MRNLLAKLSILLLAATLFSALALAQNRGGGEGAQAGRGGFPAGGRGAVNPNMIANGVPKIPTPPGPAPKRELNGAWI
jgi:hypothetical protein